MKAAWYETQGPARDVLVVGEVPDPAPGPGEVRIEVACSGINPGDVKKRSDAFGLGMPYPRVIPHSDGSGRIDAVGDEVSPAWMGARVWCFGAQSYRASGTAAAYVIVPVENVTVLPDGVGFDQGACLGIPGLTAHRAVHVAGSVKSRTVLVQGGAGTVGMGAVAIAKHAGARVIATVRSPGDEDTARDAGADVVLGIAGASIDDVVTAIREVAPDGIDHVVEVAFHANIAINASVLRQGGSIASYATGDPAPAIPFWPLVFTNATLFFLGSDDFPPAVKRAAANDLTEMLATVWAGYPIAARFPLHDIAAAHELVEHARTRGRVILDLSDGASERCAAASDTAPQ